jgi:hypothetical protein
LSAVDLACSMKGDDLVADHVVSRCDVGDGEIPGEVVLDEVVCCPSLHTHSVSIKSELLIGSEGMLTPGLFPDFHALD